MQPTVLDVPTPPREGFSSPDSVSALISADFNPAQR